MVIRYSDSARSMKAEARISHGQHSSPNEVGIKSTGQKESLLRVPERVRQGSL